MQKNRESSKVIARALMVAGLSTVFSLNANAQVSTTWQDYVDAKTAGTVPVLPDFSYAGYQYGEVPIPDVAHTVFDVADYGAVPDDGNDDRAAIQAAIDAAEANGSGIVLLHAGRYDVSRIVPTNIDMLRINRGNIVLRGAGALHGGTEIYAEGEGRILNVRPSSLGNKTTVLATITADVPRGTREVTVDDASSLSVGQVINLWSRDPAPGLVADFFFPWTPVGSETIGSGVKVSERHEIEAINGNTITLKVPTQYDIKATYTWEIRTAGNYLQEVGLEDLALVGNWHKGEDYIHHRSRDDSAWRGVEFLHTMNSWIRRVRVTDVTQGIQIKNSVNVSALELIMDGGSITHHPMLLNISTRILVGLAEERNITVHPGGQTDANVGNVFWRYDARELGETDNHGKWGYTTLRDASSGHKPGNGSGSWTQSPRHLAYYTLWNWQYKHSGSAAEQAAHKSHNFWASIFSSIVQPIVVGYQAPPNMLVLTAEDHGHAAPKPSHNTMLINESYGQAVTPASLYEAQLEHRLGTLPAWVDQYKQDWAVFRATKVTLDESLDHSQHLEGSDITLSATVPAALTNVASVEFLNGSTVLGTDTTAPYSFTWSGASLGSHEIVARVTLTNGQHAVSTPANLYVGSLASAPIAATISHFEVDVSESTVDTHDVNNLIDNDLNTLWSSHANLQRPNSARRSQLVDFDLGSVTDVNRVDISWHRGDLRAYYFRVFVSDDNTNWNLVLDTKSSASTADYETYYFEGGPARYVRVLGTENSVDNGTVMNEVKFYAPLANQAPTANANGPYSATTGNAVSLSSAGSSDSDGSIASYSWDFGDGNSSTDANPSHTYAASGSYTVSLIVTDNQGASSTAAMGSVTVSDNAVPVANANGPYSGTAGTSISFSSAGSSDSDGSIASYSWDFGDGNSSTDANPSHSYAASGTYTATLTVTDDQGATSVAATASVTVNNALPVANANGPYTATAGTAVSLSSAGSSDSDGSIASYSWDLGDGNSSTDANPSHTYSAAGSYTVTLTVTDDQGGTANATATVEVSAVSDDDDDDDGGGGSFAGIMLLALLLMTLTRSTVNRTRESVQ